MRGEEGCGAMADKYNNIAYWSHDRCSIRAGRPAVRPDLLLTLILPDCPRGASRGCVFSPDSSTLLSGLSGCVPPSSDITVQQYRYTKIVSSQQNQHCRVQRSTFGPAGTRVAMSKRAAERQITSDTVDVEEEAEEVRRWIDEA